jgi:nitroreductase
LAGKASGAGEPAMKTKREVTREVSMSFQEIVERNRSYRRFDGGHRLEEATLRELIGLARITPSAGNRQPLKYVISCSPEWNQRIFETLAWAAYLPDWPGPDAPERPTGYVVVLLDTGIQPQADIDIGIASQTILLGAAEKGLGGCMFGSIQREELARRLSLPEKLKVAIVIALGKPVEKVILEDLPAGGSVKYYRDPSWTHHVPKRTVDELIHGSYV